MNPSGKPFFTRMSGPEMLFASLIASVEGYFEDRVPHMEAHGLDDDPRIGAIIMNVKEMEALVELCQPLAERDELPDRLCPLVSDIRAGLRNHALFKPMGESGDPNNN